MKRATFLVLFTLLILLDAQAQNMLLRADSASMNRWVDSVMSQLSPDERLGQLIMPIADSRNDEAHRQNIRRAIEVYHVGGLLFSKGDIGQQAKMTKYARSLAKKSPLWIALDGEWGLAMRLADAIKYPRNGALGTIDPAVRDSLMYLYGREVARQCRLMGININFAPVLDINSNPNNPVIGNRSFGATVEAVTLPALSYSRGLEDGGILAVGKHFPGHGDTDTDSHKTLPQLSHDAERMLSFECAPFRHFINAGLGGMMIAHLSVPALDSLANNPSSLSHPIVTGLLKERLGFNGLIFTDGLAMKGVNNIADYSVKALLAGVDVLLDPIPLKSQWESLKKALANGTISQELIDERCRRVLRWKYVLCVGREEELQLKGLAERINTADARRLLETLANEIERAKQNPTLATTQTLPPLDDIDPTEQALPQEVTPTVREVIPPDTITHQPQVYNPKFHRVDSLVQDALDKDAFPGCQILVAHKGKIIYNRAFGWLDYDRSEPNSLETVYDLASVSKAAATIPALMLAYDQYGLKFSDPMSRYIPQLRKAADKRNLTIRQALLHETDIRDGYSFYAMTYDSTSFEGNHYSPVEVEPYTIRQDKKCWFHNELRFDTLWVANVKDAHHTLTIARGLYLNPLFRDSIVQKIIDLPLRKPHRYRYSCLNFVLLRQLIENVTKRPMDQYLYERMPQFFGDEKLCFNPLEHGIPLARIAPTENDQAIRHQLLRGYVHDETCAWSGGVEGNAGLFGSATQLYPLLQMFLDGGRWHGKQIVNAITVERMTTQKSHISRRGLGFDKPEFDPKRMAKNNPCSTECSPATYGHSGYTGTCFWIDPKYDLIYIFLCNRINPCRWNTTLGEEEYRSRIQTYIYEAIRK